MVSLSGALQLTQPYRERYGTLASLYLGYLDRKIRYASPEKKLVTVPLPRAGIKVMLRARTSDLSVFHQVFLRTDHDIDCGFEPKIILDLGANIGLSSIFFSLKYPNAKIIAVEPDRENYELMKLNTHNFKNIHPLQAGVWNREAFLRVVNGDQGAWSIRVVEEPDEEKSDCKGLSINLIMDLFDFKTIDIVKMDIEGAEVEVLGDLVSAAQWAPKVKLFMVELHDRFRPGCSDALSHYISHSRSYSTSGEYHVVQMI